MGAVVSSRIVSVSCVAVLSKLSLNFIYTVLVPSPPESVNGIVVIQPVRFIGLVALPYATCTPPTPASVAQVVVNDTIVPLVAAALLFIVKVPPAGAVVSSKIVFAKIAEIVPLLCLHLIYTVFVPSPDASVYPTVFVHTCQFVGLVHEPKAISVHTGQVILVSSTHVVAVAAAPELIRYVTTSMVIVLVLLSSSIPPFAVPPSSLTLKVNEAYGTHVAAATGVNLICPLVIADSLITWFALIFVPFAANVPTTGVVTALNPLKRFAGKSFGSVNQKSPVVNV